MRMGSLHRIGCIRAELNERCDSSVVLEFQMACVISRRTHMNTERSWRSSGLLEGPLSHHRVAQQAIRIDLFRSISSKISSLQRFSRHRKLSCVMQHVAAAGQLKSSGAMQSSTANTDVLIGSDVQSLKDKICITSELGCKR